MFYFLVSGTLYKVNITPADTHYHFSFGLYTLGGGGDSLQSRSDLFPVGGGGIY